MLAFQRDLEEFRKLDAEVIGVSTDTMQDRRKFTRENGIEFPLVSDAKKTVKKSYGYRRVTYLIDRNGTIQVIQKGVSDNNAFLDKLKTLVQ